MSPPSRAVQRAYRSRTTAYLGEQKLARGCAKCGYAEHPDALELDHIGGGGGHAWRESSGGWTFAQVDRLLSDPNIQVLCGNCHNIKSRVEQRAAYQLWEAGLE